MGTAFGGMGGMGSSGGDEDARPSLSVVAICSVSLDPWFGSVQCYIATSLIIVAVQEFSPVVSFT